MKLNFKRIASVLTGAVMLSSTVALAGAASLDSFTKGGASSTAVVYGSKALQSDQTAAMSIATALGQSELSKATTVVKTVTVDPDSEDVVTLDKSSTKLHLGSALSTAFTRAITGDDLPNLLADGTYTDDDNDEFEYDQKIDMNGTLTPTQFSDSDYEDSDPALGIHLADGAHILDYTLDFQEEPDFTAAAMESTDLTIMGKTYFVLDVTNTTGSESITLLDAAETVVVPEGETKQVTVGGKAYSVSVDISSTPTVKVTVNGKTSNSLSDGGTYKIAPGVYVGIKDISYKSKEASVSSAELSIGSGKLVLSTGDEVEMNEENIDNLYAYITQTAGSPGTLDKIVLTWRAEEEAFITGNSSSLELPGFKSVKLLSDGMYYPGKEVVEVDTDDKAIVLNAPLKDGDVSLHLLAINDTNTIGLIGEESTKLLKTTNQTSITFDDDTDEYFVVSWADGEEAESYVLKATSFTDSDDVNKTTIKKVNDASYSKEVKNGDTIELGNAELTVGQVDKDGKSVVFARANAETNFNTLYTKEGLKVFLPWNNAVATTTPGVINLTASPTSYELQFVEEDEDGTIGSGVMFNLTLGRTASPDFDATVSSVTGDTTAYEVGNSDIYVSQVYGDLATTIEHDRGPTQQTAVINYHEAESYFKLMLAAPNAVTTTTTGNSTAGNYLTVADSEMSKFQDKNLIVVGGSCVNTVAAKLLGSDAPLCSEAFTAKTQVKAGEFLIATYQSPYNTAKIATLVAGYEAADTDAAAKYLTTKTDVNVSVGASMVKPTQLSVS